MGIFDKLKNKKDNKDNSANSKKKSRLEKHIKTEAGPKYSLERDIKTSPLAISMNTDGAARDYITEHCEAVNPERIVPGQLIMFQYFEPKHQEELEYYDASPCTLFFGTFNSKEGKRVLGFNIHYYPPKIRKRVMSKIFEIYKPIYTKYFSQGITKEIDAFDFKYLIESLQKAKLDFGVRMYIPELIGKVWSIKPNEWNVAVYTEGWFKKRTRAAIMKYWRNYKGKH